MRTLADCPGRREARSFRYSDAAASQVGSGVTLTWGCGARVADLVAMSWTSAWPSVLRDPSPMDMSTPVARRFAVRTLGLPGEARPCYCSNEPQLRWLDLLAVLHRYETLLGVCLAGGELRVEPASSPPGRPIMSHIAIGPRLTQSGWRIKPTTAVAAGRSSRMSSRRRVAMCRGMSTAVSTISGPGHVG
jgi:hypothetical protein